MNCWIEKKFRWLSTLTKTQQGYNKGQKPTTPPPTKRNIRRIERDRIGVKTVVPTKSVFSCLRWQACVNIA